MLVARLALERARAAQLLPGVDVLPLQHGDQIVALDRLTAPHAEPRQRVVGAQPQRRGASLGAPVERVLGELVVAARERLRRRLELEAVVAGPRRVGAVADLDHDLRQRQHRRRSSSCSGLIGAECGRSPGRSPSSLVRLSEARERSSGDWRDGAWDSRRRRGSGRGVGSVESRGDAGWRDDSGWRGRSGGGGGDDRGVCAGSPCRAERSTRRIIGAQDGWAASARGRDSRRDVRLVSGSSSSELLRVEGGGWRCP